MDLIIIGKFIKARRKEKGLTQLELAKKLNVSEKTISKWECGNGFPDTSLILPLCNALEITANELLSGEIISNEEYRTKAEQNFINLTQQENYKDKLLLTLENFIVCAVVVMLIGTIFFVSFVKILTVYKVLLITFSVIFSVIGIVLSVIIEKDAGFYECGKCGNKYIPTFKQVLNSMHRGRTRYMKCPKCGEKSWNKKTINKN